MRVGGQMRLPSAGTGGRIIVVALCCIGAGLVLDLSTSRNKQSWVRAISEAVIAPANADRRNRRPARERAEEVTRRTEAALRRQQLLQQSEVLQKRLQSIQQNMVLAHQKRLELLQQQMQAAQKLAQQSPQLAPVNPIANAIQLRLQHLRANHQPAPGAANNTGQVQNQPLAILKRVQEMRANHQLRHHTAMPRPALSGRGSLAAAVRQQVVLQHVMARLRHHRAGPGHSAFGHPSLLRAGTVGHHHSALLVALARARGSHHFAGHGHYRMHHGHHHQSRQHAIFHRMLDKLARHRRDRNKQPAPETVATTPETKPAVKPTTSGVALQGLGSNTPASTTLANAKLPVVASSTSDSSDAPSKNTDWSISRLGGPRQPKSDDDASGSPSGSPKAKKDDANSSPDPDAKAPRQTGRGAIVNLAAEIMRPHTFVPREILAYNLSDVGRIKAAELKFKVVEVVQLKELQLNVTRLEASGEFNAVTGLSALSEAAPAEEYGLNRVYVPYRTTAEASPSGAGTNAPPPSSKPIQAKLIPGGGLSLGTGCPAGRCFAPALINWQPELATCARDVKIGVIDTGHDKSHPTFVGARIVEPKEDIRPKGSTMASTVHGTAVLSLLAGNASSATPGLVPQATFYVQNAFYADSNGNAMSSTLTMLSALNWMREKKVDILNLSFSGPIDPKVHGAIKELTKAGTVILAAAGNDKSEEPSYPAAYGEVIAVTAVDRNLAAYAYANRGKHIDVAAPGVDVWTALPGRRAGLQTGTSFAVPFATSVVALNYPTAEFRSNGDPFAPRQRALELLQKSIKPLGGSRSLLGAGLVQAPSECDPGRGPAVAAAMPRADGWTSKVELAAPPTPVAAGVANPAADPWVGTVHSVANKR